MREEERASGIAPEETELDIALEDIIEKFIAAEEEHRQQTTDKKEKLESDSKKAAEMRKRSLETFTETQYRNVDGMPDKRARNNGSETLS